MIENIRVSVISNSNTLNDNAKSTLKKKVDKSVWYLNYIRAEYGEYRSLHSSFSTFQYVILSNSLQ